MRHTREQQTVRFWTWYGEGWVRLTLRPGDELTLATGGPTDEGFSYTQEVYTLADGVVTCEVSQQSRDCDGRHEWYRDLECDVENLTGRETYDYVSGRVLPDVRIPNWRKVGSHQRDHTAEAAGY